MGFNNVDLLLINDLVEPPELFVFFAMTKERPDFMQLLVWYLSGFSSISNSNWKTRRENFLTSHK